MSGGGAPPTAPATSAYPEQAVVLIREVDPNAIFKKFLKRGPLEFTGTEDPLVANDWIVRMEKIFRVSECLGRQRVQLATYMFCGIADDWWKTVQRPYEVTGDELSHFVEALITPESERIRRFVDGLRDDIQLHMTCMDHATYEDVMRRAYWAEERLQRVEAMHKQKRIRVAPIRQQPVVQQQQSRRQRPVEQMVQYQQRQQYRPHCACYDHGDPGHLSRNCPLR
ncbi:hypothetical protein AAC387_Pa10g0830 [Persea americana]